MADFIAVVKAQLDQASLSQIQNQINSIKPNGKIRLDVDTNYLKNQIQGALNSVTYKGKPINLNNLFNVNQAAQIGQGIGQNVFSGISKAIGGETNRKLYELGFNSNVINSLQANLDNLGKTGFEVVNITRMMNDNGNIQLKISGIDEFKNAVTIISTLDKYTKEWFNTMSQKIDVSGQNEIIEQKKVYQEQLQKIMSTLTQMSSIEAKMQGLDPNKFGDKNKLSELTSQYTALDAVFKQLFSDFNNNINTNSIWSNFDTSAALAKIDELRIKGQNSVTLATSSALDKLDLQAQKDAVSNYNNEVKLLKQTLSEMSKIEVKKAGLDATKNASEIAELDNRYKMLTQDAQSYYNSLTQQVNTNPYLQQIASISELNNLMYTYKNSANQVADIQARLNDQKIASANKIVYDIDTKNAEAKVELLKSKLDSFSQGSSYYNQYANSLKLVEDAFKDVQTASNAFTNNNTVANAENLVSANERLVESMKRTENEYKILSIEQGKLLFSSQIANTQNNFQKWCEQNSKACKVYAKEIEQLIKELSKIKTQGDLNNFNTNWKYLEMVARNAGNLGKSFTDSFTDVTQHALAFASTYFGIYRVFSTIKEGISTVIELDDALIDLRKTTTMSMDELNQFYTEANSIAKEYGATTQEIIQSAADWSRLNS